MMIRPDDANEQAREYRDTWNELEAADQASVEEKLAAAPRVAAGPDCGGISFQTCRAIKELDRDGKPEAAPATLQGEPAKGQVGTTVRPNNEKLVQSLISSGRAKNRAEADAMVKENNKSHGYER